MGEKLRDSMVSAALFSKACCGLLSKRKEDVYELSPNPSRKEEMKSLLLAKLEKNAEKKERFSQIIGRNGVLERENSKLRRAVSHELHLEEVALRTARRGSGSGPALLKAKQIHIKTDSPRDSLRLTPSKSETVQKIYGLNDQEVTKLQKSLLAIRQLRMTKEDPENDTLNQRLESAATWIKKQRPDSDEIRTKKYGKL